MLDTVVISGENGCCSVVFGTLVGVFVFSVMWPELLMTSAISCPLLSIWGSWKKRARCDPRKTTRPSHLVKLLTCCCLPTPMTLASGGESDVPACGPPASFSVHLASSAVTPAGSVHQSRGDNVVRMWVQLKR